MSKLPLNEYEKLMSEACDKMAKQDDKIKAQAAWIKEAKPWLEAYRGYLAVLADIDEPEIKANMKGHVAALDELLGRLG